MGEKMGLAVWTHDQAGPYQTKPQAGANWQPIGQPTRQPTEYIRNGTAKMLTLFHPATGHVCVRGVTHCPNAVLHPWLKRHLTQILADLPEPFPQLDPASQRQLWTQWQVGLTLRFTLPKVLPPLRMLLVLDNLAGHKTPDFVLWLVAHGIMPLYTPLSGSWLNMAESIQKILVGRALAGQQPQSTDEIIQWLEAVACHWNQAPTAFEWGGKRATRRDRSRQRRHALAGSGAWVRRAVRRTKIEKWQRSYQMTH
ncbi:MAG: transposase [Chloroflexi bacterium]|nr:transposase [Chloroflexota bacterium]MCI0650140.1 transposase [Chloroflexota bacterium]MCI0731772.1 transposase [Chloroflexota bacterium]